MAIIGQLGDRAGHSSATTGTGTITLGAALGAVAPNLCSFNSFANAGITDQMIVSYLILDSNGAWEVGRGTYTASGTTLTRGATFSSNSGSAISLSGNEQVFISFLAEDGAAASLMMFTGGRLTLTTATPVLTANTTAQGTIYYTPHLHNLISIYDGFVFQTYAFTEQSVVLDTSNALSGKAYDLFMAMNAGSPTLGYGPAWTTATGGSAARANAISRQNGVWTNTATITLRINSSTTFSAGAGKATYVGTFYATANGQTGMNFIPATAAGGTNNILGLYNAYNKVPVIAVCQTSTASWTYSTATWRAAAGSATFRISYVDGLADISPQAAYVVGQSNAGGTPGYNGVNLNSTTATPTIVGSVTNATTTGDPLQQTALGLFLPVLGFNFITAMETSDGTDTTNYVGTTTPSLSVAWLTATLLL